MPKCPYCYREEGIHNHDPILLPNGAKYKWQNDTTLIEESDIEQREYKGFYQVTNIDIVELQEALSQLEEDNGITPLTEFSSINSTGEFQITGKHIKELRDCIENLLTELGLTKTDFFNYDEEGNHIVHPNGDKTEWTDDITDDTDLVNFQIKYIHIEELRHYIESIWESFTVSGSGSCSSVGAFIDDVHNFILQKKQLWEGLTHALIETLNHLIWGSTSQSTSVINSTGYGYAEAKANNGNGTLPGVSPFGSDARASSGIYASIPVIQYITPYPCSKLVYNPITQTYDTYHLYVKAKCSVSKSATSNVFQGDIAYVDTQDSSFVTNWNAQPIIQNPYHSAGAECLLSIPTIGGSLPPYVQWVDGAYANGHAPSGGIIASLTNFNLDIAQAIIDNFPGKNPSELYVTQFNFACSVRGTGNGYAVKAGQAIWEPRPYPLNGIWHCPYYPTGGRGTAIASFTIDDINFYYKKA